MTQSVFWKIGIYQVKGGKTPEGSRPCFLGGTTNRIWLENGISPARSDRQEQELVVPCCAVVSSLAYPASTEKQNEQTCILERSLWTVENELAGAGLFQYSHSVVSDPVIPWNAARQSSLSLTNSQGLLKLMSIELVRPSNHLILSSPSLPAFNLSQHQGLFKWVSSLHQVTKVSVSASASVLPVNIQGWFRTSLPLENLPEPLLSDSTCPAWIPLLTFITASIMSTSPLDWNIFKHKGNPCFIFVPPELSLILGTKWMPNIEILKWGINKIKYLCHRSWSLMDLYNLECWKDSNNWYFTWGEIIVIKPKTRLLTKAHKDWFVLNIKLDGYCIVFCI